MGPRVCAFDANARTSNAIDTGVRSVTVVLICAVGSQLDGSTVIGDQAAVDGSLFINIAILQVSIKARDTGQGSTDVTKPWVGSASYVIVSRG
jgi:hypothetical protein